MDTKNAAPGSGTIEFTVRAVPTSGGCGGARGSVRVASGIGGVALNTVPPLEHGLARPGRAPGRAIILDSTDA